MVQGCVRSKESAFVPRKKGEGGAARLADADAALPVQGARPRPFSPLSISPSPLT